MNANDSEANKQRVLVNVILDKSGSMGTKVKDVIGGFNLYLDELAKEQSVTYGFTLTLFDTVVAVKYKAVPLSKVEKLNESSYLPAGNTALLDAIGETVQTLSTDGFEKIITVIMTDGEENSSREWSLHGIRELIKTKESAGNWTFVFLGANLDAFTQGESLGLRAANVARYDQDKYREVYASLGNMTNLFSSDAAKIAREFFRGDTPGIKKSQKNPR